MISILNLPTSTDLFDTVNRCDCERHDFTSLPPFGSAAGNMSPPQIDHAATAVMMPANPIFCQYRLLLQHNPISYQRMHSEIGNPSALLSTRGIVAAYS